MRGGGSQLPHRTQGLLRRATSCRDGPKCTLPLHCRYVFTEGAGRGGLGPLCVPTSFPSAPCNSLRHQSGQHARDDVPQWKKPVPHPKRVSTRNTLMTEPQVQALALTWKKEKSLGNRSAHTETNRQIDRHTDRQTTYRDKQTTRQTDAHTHTETDRQIDRQTDNYRQTDGQTAKQRDVRQTNRDTLTHTHNWT